MLVAVSGEFMSPARDLLYEIRVSAHPLTENEERRTKVELVECVEDTRRAVRIRSVRRT